METAEQRDTLKELKCEYVQGFMYACPLEVADWVELVQSGRALVGVPLISPVFGSSVSPGGKVPLETA